MNKMSFIPMVLGAVLVVGTSTAQADGNAPQLTDEQRYAMHQQAIERQKQARMERDRARRAEASRLIMEKAGND